MSLINHQRKICERIKTAKRYYDDKIQEFIYEKQFYPVAFPIFGCHLRKCEWHIQFWDAIRGSAKGIFGFEMPSAEVRMAYLILRCHLRKCERHFRFWDAICGSARGIFNFKMPSAEVRVAFSIFRCHLRKCERHI